MNNTYQKPETIINVKEIIWDLLEQWKAILITSLAFALLVAGAKYAKDIKAYHASNTQENTNTEIILTAEERIENILNELPEDERPTVEYLIQQNDWVAAEKEYVANSILMRTDPTNQRTLIVDYYISCDGLEESSAASIVYGYSGYVTNEKVVNSIGQVIDPGADNKYIAELIRCSNDTQEADLSIGGEGATIEVRIVLPENTDAKAVETALTDALKEHSSELNKKIGTHKITLLGSGESFLYNAEGIKNRNDVLKSIYDLTNNNKNLQSSLSDAQKDAVENITQIKKETIESENPEEQGNTGEEEVATASTINKKYALLGIVLGVLLYSFVYLLWIILRGRVNYASDVEYYTQSRLLGEVYNKTEHSGFSKLFYSKLIGRMRYKSKENADEQIKRVESSLEAICEHTGIKAITLFNIAGKDVETEAVIEKIKKGIKKKSLTVDNKKVEEKIDEKSILGIDNAVIVIEKGVGISELQHLMQLLNDYGVKIMGSIFVSNV